MASSLNTPAVLTQPIATNGNKNTIPNTNDQSLGLMSQSTGFPPICSERIADGGKAPTRADFNGAFNLISQQHYFLQNGGNYTFRQDVSDAIGGYPLDAILYYKDPNTGDVLFLQSLVANNTANFNTDSSYVDDGVNWKSIIPTESQILAEFAKKDASNFTQAGKDAIIEFGMPDYSSGIAFIGQQAIPYTAPCDGWVSVCGQIPNNSYRYFVYVNGEEVGMGISVECQSGMSTVFPVSAGDEVYMDTLPPWVSMVFYPAKGANFIPPTPPAVSYYCYNLNGSQSYVYTDHIVTTTGDLTIYHTSDASLATSSSDLTNSYTAPVTSVGSDYFMVTGGWSFTFTRYSLGDLTQ